MELSLVIKYLHPTLEFYKDYIVIDDWQWPILTWITTEFTEPTQAELDSAWVIVQEITEIKVRVARMEEINKALIQLWGTNKLTTYTNFNTIRNAKITALEAEFDAIETDLMHNYDDTLVDDELILLFTSILS